MAVSRRAVIEVDGVVTGECQWVYFLSHSFVQTHRDWYQMARCMHPLYTVSNTLRDQRAVHTIPDGARIVRSVQSKRICMLSKTIQVGVGR